VHRCCTELLDRGPGREKEGRGDASREGGKRSMGERREEGERGHRVSVAQRGRKILILLLHYIEQYQRALLV